MNFKIPFSLNQCGILCWVLLPGSPPLSEGLLCFLTAAWACWCFVGMCATEQTREQLLGRFLCTAVTCSCTHLAVCWWGSACAWISGLLNPWKQPLRQGLLKPAPWSSLTSQTQVWCNWSQLSLSMILVMVLTLIFLFVTHCDLLLFASFSSLFSSISRM